jgi:hypothetical protein
MTVAYAALHQHLRYREEETPFYVAALMDGRMYFSTRQPKLYDRMAKPIPPQEVLPGSYVNVHYRVVQGVNRMEAVQVVRVPEDECPFDPVPDDGHL